MEKPTAQPTSQPMPPPQRGWSTPEPRAISPNPAVGQYFGRGRLMNDEPPRGLAPNGHSFHPYPSPNVPRHNSLPSPLHAPERPSPPQHEESGHYDAYHPPPPPPGGSVGLAHYALSSSSGSASSQMQHPPSAQTPSASSASLAAFRLPPILQVEKQHVTTSATQAASASRRRNDALFKCPVPGCGSTFTRRFNLRGHLRSHTEERPFVCEWPGCGKGFARQHDCKRHQALHSSKAGTHACVGCGKTFSRMDALNRHLRSEGGAGCRAAIAAGDVVMMSSTPVVANQAPVSTALSQVTDEDWERPSDEESRGGSRPPSV